MAHDWRVDAWGNHDGAAGNLLGVVFHWPLGLESADMKTVNELWQQSQNDAEGMRLGYTTQQHYFAALVRADEREECAKVADEYANGLERNYSEIIADTIRARGNT